MRSGQGEFANAALNHDIVIARRSQAERAQHTGYRLIGPDRFGKENVISHRFIMAVFRDSVLAFTRAAASNEALCNQYGMTGI
jgi:hypothetical protein